MARRAYLSGLTTEITQMSERLQQEAADIVAEFAHEGEKKMEQIIQTSITPTGLRRTNGSPGRIDTGLMINSVNSNSEHDGNEFVGQFGWTGEVEKYFDYQEDGTKKIEAMHALSGANIAQREIALKRINNIGGNL